MGVAPAAAGSRRVALVLAGSSSRHGVVVLAATCGMLVVVLASSSCRIIEATRPGVDAAGGRLANADPVAGKPGGCAPLCQVELHQAEGGVVACLVRTWPGSGRTGGRQCRGGPGRVAAVRAARLLPSQAVLLQQSTRPSCSLPESCIRGDASWERWLGQLARLWQPVLLPSRQ